MASRITLFSALFCACLFVSHAQEHLQCYSPPITPEQKEYLEKLNEKLKDHSISEVNAEPLAGGPSNVAVTAHIIRQSDGNGGLTEQELTEAMDIANEYYANANISLFLYDINYIDSDDYFSFTTDRESEMTSLHNRANTINIYFTNSVCAPDGSGCYCGYAYFPGGPDVILMDNSCTINGSTLTHELGHYFFLYHTHDTRYGSELVERPGNCDAAGDLLCDTPADPNLSGVVDGNCTYQGDAVDGNGEQYDPQTNNIMSYSVKSCRDLLTDGQYDRISGANINDRNYLISYVLRFDLENEAACAGQEVTFTNTSDGIASYSWSFEGGTPATSSEENPVVVYNEPGVYNVTLSGTTDGGDVVDLFLENHVEVQPNVDADAATHSEGFEDMVLSDHILNPDGLTTFSISSSASTEGTNSLFMDNNTYSAVGQIDYFNLPKVQTHQHKKYQLSYDYAYTYYSDAYSDTVEIVYADACAITWSVALRAGGLDLSTTGGPMTASFVPQSTDDWISNSIIIDFGNDAGEYGRVALKNITGWGNNLYVDNVLLEPAVCEETYTIEKDGDQLSVNVSDDLTIEWFLDGSPIEGESSASITVTTPGSYSVSISNSNCTNTPDAFIILGLDEIQSNLKIYPYPASDIINVELDETFSRSIDSFIIRDLSGKVMMQADYTDQINISSLHSGIYLIEFQKDSQKISRRFLKQ